MQEFLSDIQFGEYNGIPWKEIASVMSKFGLKEKGR
jgi:hypothetical protein